MNQIHRLFTVIILLIASAFCGEWYQHGLAEAIKLLLVISAIYLFVIASIIWVCKGKE